jgi:hypothetical protein
MSGELVGIALLALLFAGFGLLHPADRDEGGCHACSHASDECGGGTCPLLKDL